MESLLTLVDRWHALAAHSEDNPGVVNAERDASEARHALELRLAELAGFASGLQYAGVPAPHVADRINALIVGQP